MKNPAIEFATELDLSDAAKSRKAIGLTTVTVLTGLSPNHIWRLVRDGKFPRPISISEYRRRWLEREVLAWLDEKIAARDSNSYDPKPRTKSKAAAA